MAVGEDVGFDANLIAHGALCGESSGVDFRGECFNDNALCVRLIQSVFFMVVPLLDQFDGRG